MTVRARLARKPETAAPARMGPLSKLPVFLEVSDKRAVIGGGTAPAAWKAELLAAAGAHVEIYASDVSAEMAALLVRGASSGSLTHHRRPWSTDCVAGAAIALADATTDEEARAFYCAAKAAGVPVNIIDKPRYCQFQFGSIVNRSPVVIGISTDGGAPILGQAIRRRIETLLPAHLADWGLLAKSLREHVAAAFAPGPQRRAFWERFADSAFRGPPPATTESSLLGELAHHPRREPHTQQRTGLVTLVGAGPGDPELLTLKAVRALQSADIILFDDLVSEGVLELARREAHRMMVGKRGGRDSCTQHDINQLMVKLARQGKHVVRLKCGDISIFGRAGEEIDILESHGITVSIVPGITTASALAARLGVSLTHRDHAQSLRFVTGHAQNGRLPAQLDWPGLADPRTSLVAYMARTTAPEMAGKLMAAGRSPSTPVAAMANVTSPNEASWFGVLSELAEGVATLPADAPMIIGIGEVFAQRPGQRSTRTRADIQLAEIEASR